MTQVFLVCLDQALQPTNESPQRYPLCAEAFCNGNRFYFPYERVEFYFIKVTLFVADLSSNREFTLSFVSSQVITIVTTCEDLGCGFCKRFRTYASRISPMLSLMSPLISIMARRTLAELVGRPSFRMSSSRAWGSERKAMTFFSSEEQSE